MTLEEAQALVFGQEVFFIGHFGPEHLEVRSGPIVGIGSLGPGGIWIGGGWREPVYRSIRHAFLTRAEAERASMLLAMEHP